MALAQSAYDPAPLGWQHVQISIAFQPICLDTLRFAMVPEDSAVRVELGMV